MKKQYINVRAYAEKYNLTMEQAHNEIQPLLFDLSYDWVYSDYHHKVSLPFADYLELNMDGEGKITQCSRETFELYDYDQEIILDRVVSLTCKTRDISYVEYVEFNGKQYDKRKIEQALKLIEEGEK